MSFENVYGQPTVLVLIMWIGVSLLILSISWIFEDYLLFMMVGSVLLAQLQEYVSTYQLCNGKSWSYEDHLVYSGY